MDEIRERFSTLERLEVPDLRDDITRRASQSAQRQSAHNRIAVAAVAFTISAAAIGFLVAAFRGEEPRHVGTPAPAEIDALVQGIRVRWPGEWTLVQLQGSSENGRAWPLFQLSNYDPGLATEDLCPARTNLPADGVVLYVQRDVASIADRYVEWPAQVDPGAVTAVGCGQRTTAAWKVGGARFQASLAFGQEASAKDRNTLLEAFQGLQVVDPQAPSYFHRLRPSSNTTWYVVWGVRSDEYAVAYTFFVGDPSPRDESRPSRVVAIYAPSYGFGWSPFDANKPFQQLGEGKDPSHPFAQSLGVVTSAVDRVVLRSDDGREFEVTLGPELDRYGLAARPAYVEFEPPVFGEYVVLGPNGEVLEREGDYNRRPESPSPPPPSPSLQAEGQVWLPDSEAQRNREAIEAAVDGPVLARGNNWNYPWVVYVSAAGEPTYRDADSISPLPGSTSGFRGTRYSFAPDPEVLFVGVANQKVAWFGVEGRDNRSIAGSIIPVPDSDLLLVHLTVPRSQTGDRLVARDAGGRILHEEPLESGAGSP